MTAFHLLSNEDIHRRDIITGRFINESRKLLMHGDEYLHFSLNFYLDKDCLIRLGGDIQAVSDEVIMEMTDRDQVKLVYILFEIHIEATFFTFIVSDFLFEFGSPFV